MEAERLTFVEFVESPLKYLNYKVRKKLSDIHIALLYAEQLCIELTKQLGHPPLREEWISVRNRVT